jgi:hypothetical protein
MFRYFLIVSVAGLTLALPLSHRTTMMILGAFKRPPRSSRRS